MPPVKGHLSEYKSLWGCLRWLQLRPCQNRSELRKDWERYFLSWTGIPGHQILLPPGTYFQKIQKMTAGKLLSSLMRKNSLFRRWQCWTVFKPSQSCISALLLPLGSPCPPPLGAALLGFFLFRKIILAYEGTLGFEKKEIQHEGNQRQLV